MAAWQFISAGNSFITVAHTTGRVDMQGKK
jgi:hypothetical protein